MLGTTLREESETLERFEAMSEDELDREEELTLAQLENLDKEHRAYLSKLSPRHQRFAELLGLKRKMALHSGIRIALGTHIMQHPERPKEQKPRGTPTLELAA